MVTFLMDGAMGFDAGASAALSQTILSIYFGERTVRSQAREALERLAADSGRDRRPAGRGSTTRGSTKGLTRLSLLTRGRRARNAGCRRGALSDQIATLAASDIEPRSANQRQDDVGSTW